MREIVSSSIATLPQLTMKKAGHSKVAHMEAQRKNRERVEKMYNINQKPTPIDYRPAVRIEPEDAAIVPMNGPLFDRIESLAEQDRIFRERLSNEKEFHDTFWYSHYRTGTPRGWSPSSPTQEIDLEDILDAISGRVEYALAQKLLLHKYYHLLSQPEQKKLDNLTYNEILQAECWLKPHHPNYEPLKIKLCEVIIMKL